MVQVQGHPAASAIIIRVVTEAAEVVRGFLQQLVVGIGGVTALPGASTLALVLPIEGHFSAVRDAVSTGLSSTLWSYSAYAVDGGKYFTFGKDYRAWAHPCNTVNKFGCRSALWLLVPCISFLVDFHVVFMG